MTQNKNALQIIEKNISDSVLNKVKELTQSGGINLPQNYSVANALKSAWLFLQDNPKLLSCSKPSIANSLFNMVIQGLSVSKSQGYLIPYGDKLTFQRSYIGTLAVAKRIVKNLKEVRAVIIRKGDEFEYSINENGQIIKGLHKTSFSHIESEILGAYAVREYNDGTPSDIEVMSIDDIKRAWSQGATKGSSPAHKNFTGEMVKKTVINRACKLLINTVDDNDALIGSFNRSTENEYKQDAQEVEIEEENSIEIDFEPETPKEIKDSPKVEQEDLINEELFNVKR